MRCGKSVSTPVPEGTVVRAWIECPECVETNTASHRFWLEAPRWSGAADFLAEGAAEAGIDLTFHYHRKGLLREKMSVQVKGETYRVEAFMRVVKRAVAQINGEVS